MKKTVLVVLVCFMACSIVLGLNERMTGYSYFHGERVSNIEYAFSQVQTSNTAKDDLTLLALFGAISQAKEDSTYVDNGDTQTGDVSLVALPITDDDGVYIGGAVLVSWNDHTRPSTVVNGTGQTVTIPYTPTQERFELSSYSVASYYAKVLQPFANPATFPEYDDSITDPVWVYLEQITGFTSWFGEIAISCIALFFSFLFDLVTIGIDVVRWALWLLGF